MQTPRGPTGGRFCCEAGGLVGNLWDFGRIALRCAMRCRAAPGRAELGVAALGDEGRAIEDAPGRYTDGSQQTLTSITTRGYGEPVSCLAPIPSWCDFASSIRFTSRHDRSVYLDDTRMLSAITRVTSVDHGCGGMTGRPRRLASLAIHMP